MTRQRKNYLEDFKRDAVALVTEQRYWVSDASRSLDVVANRLGRWKRKYEVQGKGELLYRDEVLE